MFSFCLSENFTQDSIFYSARNLWNLINQNDMFGYKNNINNILPLQLHS